MFINIEGIDAVSKAAVAESVTARLRKLGYRAGCRALQRAEQQTVEGTAQSRFFLDVAQSSELLEAFIRPTLARGEVAVTNGYVYGPLAEAYARGVDRMDALESAAQVAAQGMWPDLVVFLDASPAVAGLRATSAHGRGFNAFVREALHEMAKRDPHRWVVIEADFVSVDALAEQVSELVLQRLTGAEGEARAKVPGRLTHASEDLGAAFFDAIDALERTDGELSLVALQGVGGPAAHQRRLRFVNSSPDAVARSLRGVMDEESWTLRELLAASAPRGVLESLDGDGSAKAMRIRAQLVDVEPSAAVRDLAGIDTPQAWWLREQALRLRAFEGLMESLAGLDNARAWRIRSMVAARVPPAFLLRSIRGLSCPKAEALRDRNVATLPLEVLASTEGVDTRHAQQLRAQLFSKAQVAVVSSLKFVDCGHAWELREKAAPRCPEALLSVSGMSTESAWSLRERYATRWSAEAIASLGSLSATSRGAAVIDAALRGSPDLLTLRAAYIARAAERRATRIVKGQVATVETAAQI